MTRYCKTQLKKLVLVTAGAAAQKLMTQLAKEQEVLMNIADMCIDTYISESVLLRIQKLSGNGAENLDQKMEILRVQVYEAAARIQKAATDAVYSFAEGDERKGLLMAIKRFTKSPVFNVKESRRNIAAMAIEKNAYCYG